VTMDPLIPVIVSIAFCVLVLGAVLHRLRQPLLVGCIVVGVMLGPRVSGVLVDFAYRLTVATIALTMFASPFWIRLFRPSQEPAPAGTHNQE